MMFPRGSYHQAVKNFKKLGEEHSKLEYKYEYNDNSKDVPVWFDYVCVVLYTIAVIAILVYVIGGCFGLV